LVILQRLQSNLELDLKVPTSSFLISQLLKYSILTVGSFFHRPFELLAQSLDLSKSHLQVPDLLPSIPQVVIQLFLMIAEAYETSKLALHKNTFILLKQGYQCKFRPHQWLKY
jgi:hypothetical protein